MVDRRSGANAQNDVVLDVVQRAFGGDELFLIYIHALNEHSSAWFEFGA